MSVLRQFVLRDPVQARACWNFIKSNWAQLAQQSKPLTVEIKEHKAKRSTDQNKRLWLILNRISQDAWIGGKRFSAEVWHEHYKRKLIGCEEMPDGSMIGISTTTLSVSEFANYMDRIEQDAAEQFGITLD